MRRPAMAAQAYRFGSGFSAFRTDPSGIEGIPNTIAGGAALPAIGRTGFPFAFRAVYFDFSSHGEK
jgi:hypothetical protein